MIKFIVIAYFITFAGVCDCKALLRPSRQASSTTESPSDSSDEDATIIDEPMDTCSQEDAPDERGQLAAEYFPEPIPRSTVRLTLRRALEYLEKPKKDMMPVLNCRGRNVDMDAKNILRFLTGDPAIGSSEDSSSMPASSQSTQLSCEPERQFVIGKERRLVNQTVLERVMGLVDAGWTEKSINHKYAWWRRQYIPRVRAFLNNTRPVRL